MFHIAVFRHYGRTTRVTDLGVHLEKETTLQNFRTRSAAVALAGALVAVGMVNAPAANAATNSSAGASQNNDGTKADSITMDTVRQAIEEARSAGAVTAEQTTADGGTTVVIEGEGGATLELSTGGPGARLGTGTDRYGTYVAFNAFDQNLIISGALTAIASGMCALGPAVCAVAQVAALLASNAIGSGGGIRCGTKSLRVYPVSHHAPRCA